MNIKNHFYHSLIENKGRLNEIDLGEKLGFSEDETRVIISKLLSESKIEYKNYKYCNYRVLKKMLRLNGR